MIESLFAEIRDREPRFVVYGTDEWTEVETRFATHNVEIDHRSLPSGFSAPFLVVERDGEFAGALGLDALDGLLEPPIVRPGDGDSVSDAYRAVFDVLDDTVFTSMDRRRLLAISREIEDRAYRVGAGTLRVGFQTLSTFESQVEPYRRLATKTELDVHVYGVPDRTPPTVAEITFHEDADGEFERYWLLAFDGGPDESDPCGLVAKERADGYRGFWTDDRDVVRSIAAALE
ncbi:DICT sensory domain-containing protein [Halorubrum sp. DTA98]|uniref:DICT sensory domain-containing protein n=1 Tax=Halorubrum sp. DTA98 TaxID=3402163 RepID=UPI003AAE5964